MEVYRRLAAAICYGAAAAAILAPGGEKAQATLPRLADACAGASTPTNAVIRFYLAVDRRQYAAAHQCLAPTVRSQLPYATFLAGYANTVSSRLIVADGGAPYGSPVASVNVDLHAVDRAGRTLVAKTFMGSWYLDGSNHLTRGLVRELTDRQYTVSAVPPTNVADAFAFDGQKVLAHVRADVTGDGAADDLYLTGGIGCGSCHAQRIWIYSGGELVFEQPADNGELRVSRNRAGFEIRTTTPGSAGPACCPTERTYEDWSWTPFGFTRTGQRVVQTT